MLTSDRLGAALSRDAVLDQPDERAASVAPRAQVDTRPVQVRRCAAERLLEAARLAQDLHALRYGDIANVHQQLRGVLAAHDQQ